MLLVGLKKAFLAAHHGGLEDENEFFLCVCLVYFMENTEKRMTCWCFGT